MSNLFDPLLKRGLIKKERICSLRSKFFSFRVDPFQKGLGVQESKQEVTNVDSFIIKGKKCTKCYPSHDSSRDFAAIFHSETNHYENQPIQTY